MRILILTQVFYPDTVSVSQHLTDISQHFANEGHRVEVITSRYPYEDKTISYASSENLDEVKITRVWQTKCGKKTIIHRLVDYFTFNLIITLKFLFKRKYFDLVFVSTSPPFLSFITTVICNIRRVPVYFWVMDLQPELSIASGLIKEKSLTARFFSVIGNYSIRHASKMISLDRFMTNYLISRGGKPEDIITTPVWPVIDGIYEGERLSNPFRKANNFGDKIVIMYSGNHAYVHPLDTLLNVAEKLRNDDRFLFVFVGGGVRRKDVSAFKEKHNLNNIIQLPFQPRDQIKFSLSSADLQVVILGDGQVGYTHPNKVYGALFVGRPVLYIGPKESHVSDILDQIPGNISVEHGEFNELEVKLKNFLEISEKEKLEIGNSNKFYALNNLNPELLMKNISENLKKLNP